MCSLFVLQQVPGYPHRHTKEPATEGSLDIGVSARKCTPRDGVLPMEHRASNDDYALPVGHRDVHGKTGVSLDDYI